VDVSPNPACRGRRDPTLPPDQDWPAAPEPSESGWHQALDQLTQARRTLESEVRKLTDDRIREKVLGEVPYSIYTAVQQRRPAQLVSRGPDRVAEEGGWITWWFDYC
jgi:hypothetical protein